MATLHDLYRIRAEALARPLAEQITDTMMWSLTPCEIRSGFGQRYLMVYLDAKSWCCSSLRRVPTYPYTSGIIRASIDLLSGEVVDVVAVGLSVVDWDDFKRAWHQVLPSFDPVEAGHDPL
jgi:hypothetical protein